MSTSRWRLIPLRAGPGGLWWVIFFMGVRVGRTIGLDRAMAQIEFVEREVAIQERARAAFYVGDQW